MHLNWPAAQYGRDTHVYVFPTVRNVRGRPAASRDEINKRERLRTRVLGIRKRGRLSDRFIIRLSRWPFEPRLRNF